MLAYIDAGTAAAIAAVATGGLAGAKVAAQSFVAGFRGKKKTDAAESVQVASSIDVDVEDDFAEIDPHQQAA